MRPYRGFRHRGRLRQAGPERAGDLAAQLFAPRDVDPAAPRTVRGATRGAIARAVDDQAPGSVRLRGRHAAFYWQLGVSLADGPPARSDGRESLYRFARLLAARADRRDGTTFYSRARRCADAGLSPSTWKRCRRRLAAAGALVTVYPGCRRYDDHGNVRYDAAVYALVLPRRIVRKIAAARRAASPRRASGPPRSSGNCLLTDPRVTCSEGPDDNGARSARPHQLARPPQAAGARAGPGDRRPGGRLYGAGQTGAQPRVPAIEAAMLAAGYSPADVGQLLDRWPTGQPEPRRRASIEAPFLAAGWTRADLAYAYECRPGGRRHAHTDPARAPVALLRWRLAWWLADRAAVDAGRVPWHLASVLPSRAQQLAAADSARLADQAAMRAARVAAAAAKAPASVRDAILGQLRARMGWTADDRPRPRAARPESGNDQEGPP